jgi:glycosyltransferase involved in cell wall biosynthesis
MSCGLPVVATSVGGAPEIIQHQKTGWLISPDDTDGLLSGILTLLSVEDSGERLGKKAREYVSRNCDINKSADLLCDTYQQILKIEVTEP